jgi:protein SCO1
MDFRTLQLTGLGGLSLTGLFEGFLSQPDWSAPRPGAQRRAPQQGIPNVALKTHTGAKVRFYDDLVRDKLVVVNMMYAGCNNTCPPTTHNLVKVQQLLKDRMGRDVFMYSITLRPQHDSPEDLAHYAKLHGVQPGWLFLTGAPRDVEQLRLALGFYDPDAAVDRQEGRHVGMLRIGNDAFRRWGMAPALADPRQIVAAIQHMDRKKPTGQAAG